MTRFLLCAAVTGVLATHGSLANARPAAHEPSSFGRFEVAFEKGECHISIRRATGAATKLLSVDSCQSGVPGAMVEAVERVGNVTFPAVASAQEFHIFKIPSARGGNAASTEDFWVTVLTATGAWSTPTFFRAESVGPARVIATPSTSVMVLDDSPSTTKPGVRYVVAFGKIQSFPLPKLLSWPVFEEDRSVVGELGNGNHAENWRPTIDSGSARFVLDEDGPCNVRSAMNHTVRAHVHLTTWDDGRTVARCSSIEIQK